MKIKKLKLLCLCLFVVGAFTSCRSKTPEEKADRVISKISSKLDLTDIQVTKLKEIKTKVFEIKAAYKDEHKNSHEEIKELLLSEEITTDDIKSLIQKKTNRIDEILPQILPQVLEFHASLTKEQKAEVIECMEKFKKWRY